jgi:hypothetical protein
VSSEQVWLLVGGAFALAMLVLVTLAGRAAARAHRELSASRAQARELADRLALVEESLVRSKTASRDTQRYVITHMGDDPPDSAAPPVVGGVDGRLFADIVARESAIKALGLAHGLRRALAPEVRNRIRFEMRREVQRSRRQRRAELKTALREFRARERAELAEDQDERRDEGDAA